MYGQKRARHKSRRLRHTKRQILLVLAGLVGLFVLTNLALWGLYASKTYPDTKVMDTTIGSVPYSSLSDKVDSLSLLPDSITLQHDDTKATVKLHELGITKDTSRTIASAKAQKSWLPIVNLFSKPVLEAPVRINSAKLDQATPALVKTFTAEPVNARLTLDGVIVAVVESKDGYSLDAAKLSNSLLGAFDTGNTKTLSVPVTTTNPAKNAQDMADQKKAVEDQLNTVIAYQYNGKSKQATKEQIASWYIPSGDTLAPSKDRILSFIAETGKSFGIAVKDSAVVTDSTYDALIKNKGFSTALIANPVLKTFKYCTNARGVSVAELPALRDKLKSTYSSSKGWSLNGQVNFEAVTTGCDFTVWLAASSQMPTFGSICDAMWSCRVGPNVVLNYDRWTGASPAWNEYGGTLEDYRHMVINHETGHWLGFGHASCPGAGQQAPVMQQQSISLQGCKFSPWPSAGELATLRSQLAI